MAVRQVVKIDEDLCNGCGDCVPHCAEGAIQIINGKAKLVRDNLCDGLGACLGDCPLGAISMEEREADDFDEAAVDQHMAQLADAEAKKRDIPVMAPVAKSPGAGGGCPGSRMMQFDQVGDKPAAGNSDSSGQSGDQASELRQWPVQLHLVPPTAPFFQKADVLLAADCAAFSMGNFHRDHLKGRGLAMACPKLDQGRDIYLKKLIAMIDEAQINTLTVMIMEVPCCTGLARLAVDAVAAAKRKVPLKKIVVGIRGDVLSEEWV